MSNPGLRERKKQKTRWSIQEHALRLFAAQGYDATTVEQIAAAAEVSPSTFFRYFKTKEDVVVQDEYDPVLLAAISSAPADLGPLPALRHALRDAFHQLAGEDMAKLMERARLTLGVPALRARTWENVLSTVAVFAPPVAARAGMAPDDLRVRAFTGACLGAFIVAIQDWVDSDGARELVDLMDEALGGVADLAC